MTNRQITDDDIIKAKTVDIAGFLRNNGCEVKDKGHTSICSSPFSSDSTPSFVIYSSKNRFKDYSTGKGGDVVDLAQSLLGISFIEAVFMLNEEELPVWDEKTYKKKAKKQKPFDIANYTTGHRHEIKAIDDYARLRGITHNYLHGFFSKKIGFQWLRFPSIMFPHEDLDGKIIGAKFRNVSHDSITGVMGGRFTARGSMGYYICDNFYGGIGYDTYIVEGEANANSLCEYFEDGEVEARVISFGGVGAVPREIPNSDYGLLFIVIDYDGDEELYQERLKQYEHFNGIPIKLELPKGEDINSLWASGNLEMLNKLL